MFRNTVLLLMVWILNHAHENVALVDLSEASMKKAAEDPSGQPNSGWVIQKGFS